jgi:hypothetical protein
LSQTNNKTTDAQSKNLNDSQTSTANYYCTWPHCDYVQQGKRDVFKAKRHVWDKHLKKDVNFANWQFEKRGSNGPPGYGNMSQFEREKVNDEIMKYLTGTHYEKYKIIHS